MFLLEMVIEEKVQNEKEYLLKEEKNIRKRKTKNDKSMLIKGHNASIMISEY